MAATDITSLEIRVRSLEAQQAGDRLDDLENSAKKAEKATDGLTAAFRRYLGPAVAVAAAVKGLKETVRVTREFDILSAGLITATESAEGASQAFNEIQEFAENTPYDLQQVTEAFTTLVNRGLEPSERALIAYGDTAASMGRDLSGFINAVAQATVGEFETLKTFGVKAKNQGDTISFTFRGVTTTVRNSARDIENYLIQLGEVNFAGAMERRMESLDGAMSNFGDAWDKLVLDISQSGLGEAIEDEVRTGISVLDELGFHVRVLSDNVKLQDVQRQIRETGIELLDASNLLFKFQEEGDPRRIQIFTDRVAELERELQRLSEKEIELTVSAGNEDVLAKFRALSSGDPTAVNKVRDDLRTEEEAIKASYDERNKVILARRSELDEAVKAAEAALAVETDAQRKKSIASKLATFTQERDEYAALQDDLLERSKQRYDEERSESLKSLTDQLTAEAVKISEAYDERQRIIDAATDISEERRRQLTERNLALFDEETAALAEREERRQFELYEARAAARESLQDLDERLMTEVEAYLYQHDLIAEAEREHQRIIDEIKTNAFLTEMQRIEALAKEEIRHQEAKKRAALNTNRAMLSNAAATAQSLGEIAQGLAGKQSKAAKIMFAVQKALAISESILNIQSALAKAANTPFPANLAAIAQVAGIGASIISTIKGTNYSGAYDDGGYIPAGKYGIAGEFGPEVVNGPANITSRRETADLARQALTANSSAGQVAGGNTVNGPVMELHLYGVEADNAEKTAELVREVMIDEKREGGVLEMLS